MEKIFNLYKENVRVGVSGNDCVNVLLWSADVLKSIDRAIIMKMLNSKL